MWHDLSKTKHNDDVDYDVGDVNEDNDDDDDNQADDYDDHHQIIIINILIIIVVVIIFILTIIVITIIVIKIIHSNELKPETREQLYLTWSVGQSRQKRFKDLR